MERHGAVILFPLGAPRDWCELALVKMIQQGLIEQPFGTPAETVQEYDDGREENDDRPMCGPVWYIP